MCLLVVGSRLRDDLPLVVGANRDERLDRAAIPMDVLAKAPLVLGGRDLLAGGTWLAVNEHGVVGAITNRPAREQGRDPTKRSRGELPLALATHRSARDAIAGFADRFPPSDYNPSWVFVADPDVVFSIDMTGADVDVVEHGPGLHIFENCAPGTDTAKIENVRATVRDLADIPLDEVEPYVAAALARHDIPEADRESPVAAARAACVHGTEYGTRWSAVVLVGNDPTSRPRLRYAAGQPCAIPFVDASWE